MQCPSCRFENMPGSGHCARCSGLLVIGSVDVHPPRASSIQRRMPVEIRTGAYRLRMATAEFAARLVGVLPIRSRAAVAGGAWLEPRPTVTAGRRIGGESLQDIELDAADWPRLLIAGWVQMRHGELVRGRCLFAGMLVLLLLSVLLAGTSGGAAALGALFGWHVLATVDAICRWFEGFADRIRFTLWIAVALAASVYAPVLWAVSRVAQPLSINHDTRYFDHGDVLWYRPVAQPVVGELVLYDVPAQTVAGRRGPTAVNIRIEGQRINRVVAVAGQRLSWQGSQLMIDGTPSRWQPQVAQAGMDFIVPNDYVYILPDDLVPQQFQATAGIGMAMGVVPVSSVQGIVLWRTHPLARLERF